MMDDVAVDELCCGTTCDRAERDAQVKLLGAQEYLFVVFKSVNLSDVEKEVLKTAFRRYQSEVT